MGELRTLSPGPGSRHGSREVVRPSAAGGVVIAKAATVGQHLLLPGETAAWYETTIYARVNGYVASWQVDIGDRVKTGQVLATIDTPELDAEFAASQAQLKASQAQVDERKAEAGIQQIDQRTLARFAQGGCLRAGARGKTGGLREAMARLYAANAQVFLDKAKVDQYTALTEFRQVSRRPSTGSSPSGRSISEIS